MGAVISVNFYYRLIGEKKRPGESAVIPGGAVIALAVIYGLDCTCMKDPLLALSKTEKLPFAYLCKKGGDIFISKCQHGHYCWWPFYRITALL